MVQDMVMARLLVIDDDPLVLKLAKKMFERENYEVRTSLHPLDLTDDERRWADLAVVDLRLDGASGIDVARDLRRVNPRIAILGWSADDSPEEHSCWRAVCDRTTTKPFSFKALLLLVAEMLGSSRSTSDVVGPRF